MTELQIAPCSHEAAKFAVENWHYSRVLPPGKLVKYGVWEDGKFIGAVLYGRGASPHLGTGLELDLTEICELLRIALTTHKTPVSQIVARTLTDLRKTQPGLRLVFSFADPKEGHRGGIYQAGNWIYTGRSNPVTEYFIDGRWRHTRGVYHYKERPTAPKRQAPGKYRYLYPLDKAMRRKITRLALPYPGGSGLNSETLSSPERRSGAIPENRSNSHD